MELFSKIVNGRKPLTIFAKSSILNASSVNLLNLDKVNAVLYVFKVNQKGTRKITRNSKMQNLWISVDSQHNKKKIIFLFYLFTFFFEFLNRDTLWKQIIFNFRRLKLNSLKLLKSVRLHNHQIISKTPKTELFVKIVNGFNLWTIFEKVPSYQFTRVMNTPSLLIIILPVSPFACFYISIFVTTIFFSTFS